ncbi:hypothetical protein EVAR_26573_1 [Eumeta japonica]|uniref:Uncharacterized protein n=1 Tax=Eumeta variegata TaxID=151549 RepID=A0A4C1W473_EUMVA|nr:hypothetical protein EVAR_26573_1 [Eumeta japonica]
MPSDNHKIVTRADRTPFGEHARRINAPTIDEVAIVIPDDQFQPRDIVLHRRNDQLQRVSELHRSYDALQYPILHWKGDDGYRINIPMIDPRTVQLGMTALNREIHDLFDRELQREQEFNMYMTQSYKPFPIMQVDYISWMHLVVQAKLSCDIDFSDYSIGTEIALALASSEIASTLLEGGGTVQSALKLPLNVQNYRNHDWLRERAILAPKNIHINAINFQIQAKLPGVVTTYKSIDSVMNQDEAMNYPIEFLNSLEPAGIPPHCLNLKSGPFDVVKRISSRAVCGARALRPPDAPDASVRRPNAGPVSLLCKHSRIDLRSTLGRNVIRGTHCRTLTGSEALAYAVAGTKRGGGGKRHSGGFNWRGVIYRRRAPPLSDYGAAPAPNYFKLNLAKSNRKRKDRAAYRPGRGG